MSNSTKRYITHTRKTNNCKKVSEITDYKYYEDADKSKYYEATKKDFCDKFYSHGNVFSDDGRENKPECELNTSSNNENYLQTKSNDTTTDNLLNLPNF